MSDDAATLHRLTRHGSPLDAADRRRLVAFRPLDPSNRPAPFKRYVARQPAPLTRDFDLSSARAADVLSRGARGVVEAPWDAKRLARLLFFSNGVSRTSRGAFGDTTYFSTAMSAGNLHPVEIYVRDADRRLAIPICFADSDDAPLLLGREGFFDAFGIYFDKKNLLTRFDW